MHFGVHDKFCMLTFYKTDLSFLPLQSLLSLLFPSPEQNNQDIEKLPTENHVPSIVAFISIIITIALGTNDLTRGAEAPSI